MRRRASGRSSRPRPAVALLAAGPADGASLPSVATGHRPGPDVLYAPAAEAPHFENAAPWRAEPMLVSGGTSYRDGELVHQDFLYDDHGAAGAQDPEDPFNALEFLFSPKHGTLTYPTDPAFANNAADLVELRVKPLADATAFRVTLNHVADPARTAFTIALGSSAVPQRVAARRRRALARRALPHRPRHDRGADRRRDRRAEDARADGRPSTPAAGSSTCACRTRRGTRAAGDRPRRRRRRPVGPGRRRLPDPDARRRRRPRGPAAARRRTRRSSTWPSARASRCRRSPSPPLANTIVEGGAGVKADGTWWRERAQGDALATGDVGAFFFEVDFAKLAAGTRDDSARAEGRPPQPRPRQPLRQRRGRRPRPQVPHRQQRPDGASRRRARGASSGSSSRTRSTCRASPRRRAATGSRC